MGCEGLGYHGRAVLRGGEGWDRMRFPGLVAQRQSGRLITDWSLVRIQAGPPNWGEMRSSFDILPPSRSVPNAMLACSAPTQLEGTGMKLQAIH